MPKSSTKVTPSTPTLNKQQSISEISENNSSSSSYSDDDLEGPHDLAHVLRKQTKCKELLKKFRAYYISVKKPEVIVNNSDSMEFMHEIFMNIKYLIKESKDQINSLDLLSDTDLVSIFVEVFDYCFLGLSLTTGKKGNLYEDVLKMHHYLNSLSQLVWCLTNFSSKFRINFHSCDGTRSLLQFIQNKKVVENFIIYKRNDLLQMDPKYSLMKALIGSLHNLSKTVSFEGLNASNTLLSFSHTIKSEKQTYLMPIYMTLANVLTDKEIDELEDTIEIVDLLVKNIRQCADVLVEKKALGTIPRVTIDLENGRKVNVCAISDQNGIQWDLTELISGLYRIAANDKIKNYIYSNCNIKNVAERLINYGNIVEKEYAIRLLHQLSFDMQVAQAIYNDQYLLKTIRKIQKMYEKDNRPECADLIQHCKNFFFSVENKLDKNRKRILSMNSEDAVAATTTTANLEKGGSTTKTAKKKQIMISYNKTNREMCLKIKSALEQLGFLIWIDVENIAGSSLEAMASAIESSDCILMCMSEKYKLSPNCRAEAEYTYTTQKYFIPLIMQAEYKPDGWLGILLGSRIFVDFSKYSFDEAMSRLKKELSQIFNQELLTTQTISTQLTTSIKPDQTQQLQSTNMIVNGTGETKPVENMTVKQWDNAKVKKWLSEIAVDRSISSELRNFDGEMLEELNSIREKASEYFYKSISKNYQVDLSQVTRFSKQLRKLFS